MIMKNSYLVMALLLLLSLITTLINQGDCQTSVVGSVFNSSEEIENITLQYNQALKTRFSELWLFPSIRFRTSGNITGWQFASAEIINGGGARPRLSIWRPDPQNSDLYTLQDSRVMVNNITSEATLPNGQRVQFHVGGPTAEMMFNEGDIVGVLYRTSNIAMFAPYLYNTSIIDPFGKPGSPPSLGYHLSSRTDSRGTLSLRNDLQSATFLPILAIDVCVTCPTDAEVCMGNDSLDWESECEEPMASTSPPIDATTTTQTLVNTTTDSPSTADGSDFLELIVIVAPAVGGAVLLGVCLLMVMSVCCCCLYRRKKRRKSVHLATDHADSIPMESADNSVTVLGNGVHTYATINQIDEEPTTVSISSEFDNSPNTNAASAGTVANGNGHLQTKQPASSVANYEQPIFSQSQHESTFIEDPGYDQIKPVNKHLKVGGSVSSRTGSSLPELPHPYDIHQLSPLMPRTPIMTQVTPPADNSFYHTLETGYGTPPLSNTLGLSSTVTHTTRSRRENGHPGDTIRSRQSPSPKSSPEPRFRLRSSSRGALTPKTSLTGTLEPATPPTFFSLETGVYVPTQDQRNQFESFNMDSEPIFDDTVYACLSQAPHSPFVNNWSFFDESESYWKPASDSNTLYEQLSLRKYREILRKQIEITGHLGSGQFGKVAKGVWHTEQGDLDIAVKKLNKKASERDTVRFLQEAAIMGQFKHPNIVRLHGVVTVGSPVMIVLELMRNGDLRNYLKSLRPVPGEMVPGDVPQRLLDFCSQIALGMEYLSRKDFVHRDLAARNILLTEDYVCKIADFGMSRDLDDEDYYMSQGGIIPIKWTAPEAFNFRKYSTASDVWSFGVLVYEAWSLGHTPFRNKTPDETIILVESGYRLPPPPGCPRAVYQLMIDCWHPDHSKRPSFTKLVQSLSQPEEVLLKWASEDSNVHYQVTSLGARLEVGENLYPGLSKKYIST